jgi:AsmA protein
VKHLLSKRVIAAFCLLLLLLFLLRPGAGWMKARVTNSISQALGRSLEIGSVRLRFLPRPGFEINDLLVRDGSGFGAEPLLRAPDVTAAVSLSALLRGRMEIARLSLSEPSLNLTRNQNGQWNLEDLIDRTSHSSMAPTGADRQKSKGPSFPYVEATDARVNLKLGTEKTHFALTNAEFALWQESADT